MAEPVIVAIPVVEDLIVTEHEPEMPVVQLDEDKVPRSVVKLISFPDAVSDVVAVIVDVDDPSAGTDGDDAEREIYGIGAAEQIQLLVQNPAPQESPGLSPSQAASAPQL